MIGAAAVAILAVYTAVGAGAESVRRALIDVYGLVVVPGVSLIALPVGIAGLFRPPRKAQISALLLTITAAAFLANTVVRGELRHRSYEADRARWQLGRKLYWQESIRCIGNLDARFGPLERRNEPCRGNMLGTAGRTPSAPISRVIVNDDARIYLLTESAPGVEELWPFESSWFRDGIVSTAARGPLRVTLHPAPSGQCSASIESGGGESNFSLAKAPELPRCEAPQHPPVRAVGSWSMVHDTIDLFGVGGKVALAQIHLWQAGDQFLGLLFTSTAVDAGRQATVIGTRFRATIGGDGHSWIGHRYDSTGTRSALTVTVANGRATVRIFDSDQDLQLEEKQAISVPKVALAPVRDTKLFISYFDSVLGEVSANWTAPAVTEPRP